MSANALINYDTACRALAMAAKVDEVLNIRDQAEAIRLYGKQAKNTELEVYATEIRLRAERKLGELLIKQKEEIGLNTGGRPKEKTGSSAEPVFSEPEKTGSFAEPPSSPPTLAEMGIDKKLSARSQKLAQIPNEEFEETLAEHRENIRAENARVVKKLERKGEKKGRDFDFDANREIDRLIAENDELKERLGEISSMLEELQAENESMTRVLDANDQVTAALAEAKRYREQNRILEERIRGLMNEKNGAIRAAKSWQRKAEKANAA